MPDSPAVHSPDVVWREYNFKYMLDQNELMTTNRWYTVTNQGELVNWSLGAPFDPSVADPIPLFIEWPSKACITTRSSLKP